jgi:hypothetical protein
MLIRAAMVAAGFFVEFVVCYADLLAQEPRNEKPVQAPDSWIGKQVAHPGDSRQTQGCGCLPSTRLDRDDDPE